MMISKTLGDALNDQVRWELYSAYLYLSMATYFESLRLRGFANWMKVQAQEETTHAMRIFDYLAGRGYRIRLLPIDAPPSEWDSPVRVFEETLNHEKKVTGLINNLVELSIEEKDEDAGGMLRWFVHEQEEEEESAERVLNRARAASESGDMGALDAELGRREFHPQALES
jgi:ferritin